MKTIWRVMMIVCTVVPVVRAQESTDVTLLFVGDLMMHMPQMNHAAQADGSYAFDTCFAPIAPILQQADLTIGNLETTLGDKPYSGYPRFSAPDDYLMSLQRVGFDVLTTANNHCCDRNRAGLERTIMMLDSVGMYHLGTYTNEESRRKHYPLIINIYGIRVAFLSATFSTNGIAVPGGCWVNSLDRLELALDIRKAQSVHPDMIIALLHWGNEYQHMPSTEQIQLAEWLIGKGVDHVIGSHPHVVQPFIIDNNRHLVAYSLGNFFSNQMEADRATGLMLQLHLHKDEKGTQLSKVGQKYTWVSRPQVSGRKQYMIYPIDYPDSLLNRAEIQFRSEVTRQLNK